MFKKISVPLLILLTVFFALGLSSVVAAAEVVDGLHNSYIYSAKDYILYLENESKKDQEAVEVLKQFKALNHYQQELFVKALQPETYIKIVEKVLNSKEGEKLFITIDNVKIPINSNKSYKDKSDFVPMSNLRWVKVEQKVALFGINLTTFYTSVHFEHSGTNATRALSSSQGHSNYNPFMMVTPRGVSTPYISGGLAYATGSWTIGITPTGGLFYSEDAELSVRANATDQWKRMWSTIPAWNTGWVWASNVY
ncbi:hypothetical protein [Desulfitibacter alkalitolerans]|uniref:hypothetical protein n=1 Tax=Desulfitibacter alkalitolerans TaxID=264641 RepID=UPI000488C6C9|nr:hypothetical protein [Desulfitibacter alkalitolerans]